MLFTHTPEERMTTSRRICSSVLAFTFVLTTGTLGSAAAAAKGASDAQSSAATADKAGHGDKININTADVKELMKLTGVHKKTAENIVEYRQSHGLFKKPEEVVKVDGIGQALFQKNRARIVVE
jgi:competence protein ComEA